MVEVTTLQPCTIPLLLILYKVAVSISVFWPTFCMTDMILFPEDSQMTSFSTNANE